MTFKATTTVWQRAKDEQKHRRRSTWKNQFRDADIKTIAQWIWKKAQGPAPASVHEHKVAQTDSEATPLIYEFWHNLWKNQHGPPALKKTLLICWRHFSQKRHPVDGAHLLGHAGTS